MPTFDPQAYGSHCAALLVDWDRAELGAGRPQQQHRAALEALTLDQIGAGRLVADKQMAACCLSGLWLAHNFLDESHRVSQDIPSTSGSFWHGIMHRREGDFGNAKYWFHRVGDHPVYAPLAAQSAALAGAETALEPEARFLLDSTAWDAPAMVNLVAQAVRGRSQHTELCQRIVLAEWQLLFDYCYQQAFA